LIPKEDYIEEQCVVIADQSIGESTTRIRKKLKMHKIY